MNKNIHEFSQTKFEKKEEILERIGIRGRLAMELASLKLPILPGFIIDADVAADLQKQKLQPVLKKQFDTFKKAVAKEMGNAENPMLCKIVISPSLAIADYPTLHNFGLVKSTIEGFNKVVGEDFGYQEMEFLLKGILEVEKRIAVLEEADQKEIDKLEKIQDQIQDHLKAHSSKISIKERQKVITACEAILPADFWEDALLQMEYCLKRISHFIDLEAKAEENENDTAILVAPMVYGNYGKDSASGTFYTRNTVTGDPELEGVFLTEEFNELEVEGKDINKIEEKYKKELKEIASIIEDKYREIRKVRFTIEKGKLWLIEQQPTANKSTQADIKILLDLYNNKKIDAAYVVNAIKPSQLTSLLHPTVDTRSLKKLDTIEGGVNGAPGAAIGRVYFDADSLIDAYKHAQLNGLDTRFILCEEATYAEDVKAIEVSTGVLSSEGGYAAHASVVARQYGKVSLVNPKLKISNNKATIDGITIKEGDLITLNVPNHGTPTILFGEADLIEPDPEKSGLIDFIAITKSQLKDFHVRVNTDSPEGAELALKFGAEGVGLCRTEHMFFDEKRINVFRQMILSSSREEREKVLKKLKVMQKKDFYGILKAMNGRPVTIRLLDAPLHEFLPHDDAERKAFLDFCNSQPGAVKISARAVKEQSEAIQEINPMLGHRGCRVAVTYPEIYAMQVESLFEAIIQLKKEGIKSHTEVMVPLIMNSNELKLILYGKKIEGQNYRGLIEIIDEVMNNAKVKDIPFKVGTMIELPASAVGAGEIARYAEFFSFGTNDLTQTTYGVSRDDSTSFMPDYTLYDLLEGNLFQLLGDGVKELIQIAVRRGRLTRPEMKLGLCGEHGATPENVAFCMDTGLDYVSCSVYSVPIAMLAVAQHELEMAES